MGRIILYSLTGLFVSLYYFSFSFSFLPVGVNTKMLLALGGILLAGYHIIQSRALTINRPLLGAVGFVVLFSMIGFISVDYNHTDDLSYATYFISFGVWLFAAYAICTLIRKVHGKINFTIVTYYLAGVCFAQCIVALLIDSIPIFQLYVNQYVEQEQGFLMEVNRLYGIGASLDNAGVRFSIVLILMAAILSKETEVRRSQWKLIVLLISFFTIVVIGNMISRTTSIGAGLALLYFMWNTGIFRLVIKPDFFKFHLIFGSILVIAILITTYFYENDRGFHDEIRFAFEGFFNWVEKGEWRTGSTDKLNEHMWIWPTDLKTWIIGSGLFENWIYGTDIGYCRLILYCGLSGFIVFSLFFIYHAAVFAGKYRQYRDMFLFLLILGFVIWIKVSTDIFLIYALFYCIDILNPAKKLNKQDENSLLYTRYV